MAEQKGEYRPKWKDLRDGKRRKKTDWKQKRQFKDNERRYKDD